MLLTLLPTLEVLVWKVRLSFTIYSHYTTRINRIYTSLKSYIFVVFEMSVFESKIWLPLFYSMLKFAKMVTMTWHLSSPKMFLCGCNGNKTMNMGLQINDIRYLARL